MPENNKSFESLRRRILDEPIYASNGRHTGRLWRVAENVRANAQRASCDDRLLHLLSRIGVFSRGLAHDLRSGHTSVEDTAKLLDQLADLGDLSFDEWLHGT